MKKGWIKSGESGAYQYKGCGLDNVYLINGYEIVKDEDDEGVIIQDLDELHTAIAHYLAAEQKVLSGKEIRYLRTFLDLSQSKLGKLLGVDSQMVARYEKEKSVIPAPTDRLLRTLVIGHIAGRINVEEFVRKIEELEGGDSNAFHFKSTEKGWKAA